MSKQSTLVVGAGFVGLATATFLAKKNYPVTVVEKNPLLVESLNTGRLHFREPRLQKEFGRLIKARRISIKNPGSKEFAAARFIVIAIDSAEPSKWKMRQSAFERMAARIGSSQRQGRGTVILKSTNILGFADMFRGLLAGTPKGALLDVAVAPEFLREGLAYEDTATPWRVVLGIPGARRNTAAERLLRSVYPARTPFVVTDLQSAELIKLGSNLYLAHRLAFINELAEYARQEQLDIEAVRRGIGNDPRIGLDYFSPGLGFGGSCLPKDCHLVNSNELKRSFDFQTAYTALLINDQIVEGVIERLKDRLGPLKTRRIAILGLAFKPETDDTRGSQAVVLARMLRRRGVKLGLFDPYLTSAGKLPESNLRLSGSLSEALHKAEAVVIGCAHRRFSRLRPGELKKMTGRAFVVVDYFNHLNRLKWAKEGVEFL